MNLAQSLWQAFELDRHRYVTIVGGGGKTSLMFALAGAAAARGENVLCTTSTRILVPEGGALVAETGSELVEQLRPLKGAQCAGRSRDERKLMGFASAELDVVAASGWARLLLVEADGSGGRSLKAHESWEPVVSTRADAMIAVLGADALGSTLDEAQVHRSALFSERHGVAMGSELGEREVLAVFRHPLGYLRTLPSAATLFIFVSKAGRFPEQARRLASALQRLRLGRVLFGELVADQPWLRAAAELG